MLSKGILLFKKVGTIILERKIHIDSRMKSSTFITFYRMFIKDFS